MFSATFALALLAVFLAVFGARGVVRIVRVVATVAPGSLALGSWVKMREERGKKRKKVSEIL